MSASPSMTVPYAERSFTSPDGLRLHARDYAPGDGEARLPVVCLHGLSRNAADFGELAPWIAGKGRRVLVPDMRGRGRSAWDPEPMRYIPPTYAADVGCLLDALGVGRALFIGTSMGGIITMILASMRPVMVAGAVLNDVGPSLAPEGLKRIGGYVGLGGPVSGWAEAADYARKINEFAFPAYAPERWDAFARRLFETAPDGGLRLAYDPDISVPFKAADPEAPAFDMTPLFLGLAAGRPILLIRGAISDLIDKERAEEMRTLVPHMDYAEVAGVGHAPMLDEPEALDALTKFLDSAP